MIEEKICKICKKKTTRWIEILELKKKSIVYCQECYLKERKENLEEK